MERGERKKKKSCFLPLNKGGKNIKPLILLHGDRTLRGKAAPKRCPPSMKRSVRIKNNIIIGEKEGGGDMGTFASVLLLLHLSSPCVGLSEPGMTQACFLI